MANVPSAPLSLCFKGGTLTLSGTSFPEQPLEFKETKAVLTGLKRAGYPLPTNKSRKTTKLNTLPPKQVVCACDVLLRLT